jgi:hypothetical protein
MYRIPPTPLAKGGDLRGGRGRLGARITMPGMAIDIWKWNPGKSGMGRPYGRGGGRNVCSGGIATTDEHRWTQIGIRINLRAG